MLWIYITLFEKKNYDNLLKSKSLMSCKRPSTVTTKFHNIFTINLNINIF